MPPIAACCSPTCLAPTLCASAGPPEPPRGWAASKWESPEPLLRKYGIRYLQIGGDTWNRCGPGWLNLDGNFDKGDGVVAPNQPFTDDTNRHNMKHEVSQTSKLPFMDGAVQMVYSEHMLEHMLPSEGGVNFLKEAYRVLAPGGVLRLVTPDVDKYACAFVEQATTGTGGFLEKHAARFQPMETNLLGMPPSRATIINNIFRNYGHQWVYNFEEVKLAAKAAGIPVSSASICRSDRGVFGTRRARGDVGALGLPLWARKVMRRANNAQNETQQCWLDQEVREGESMYINIFKPL